MRVRELVAKGHESIGTPRQLARFLCGISSPATTRAKLHKETNLFGAYASISFKVTLGFVGKVVRAVRG